MFVPAAYVIAPRERLIDALKGLDPEFVEVVEEPTVIWRDRERFEVNYSSDWYRTRMMHVQALFLLDFREAYFASQEDASVSQTLRKLFGFPKVDVRVFDDWWTIRRVANRTFFERSTKKFDAATLASVRNGDEPIPGLVEAFAIDEEA